MGIAWKAGRLAVADSPGPTRPRRGYREGSHQDFPIVLGYRVGWTIVAIWQTSKGIRILGTNVAPPRQDDHLDFVTRPEGELGQS